MSRLHVVSSHELDFAIVFRVRKRRDGAEEMEVARLSEGCL